MKYKIIVDKQPKTNPSKDKRTYEIDIEELRYKGDIHDSLIITKNEDYVMRRLSLSEYQVLSVLDTPKKEPLKDVNIELFEGDNYIYLMDMTGNRLYIEYLVKNEFNDLYVLQSEMSSAITQTAKEIDLSVSRKLEGYSTKEATEASLKVMAEEIKSEVKEVKENAITEVDVLYALGDTTTTAPTSGWGTTAPQWQENKFMWQKTVTTYADKTTSESAPVCISGSRGQDGLQGTQGIPGINGEPGKDGKDGKDGTNGKDGINGKDGVDGKTTYFHIKYSSVANPTASSQISETPNTYIGTYVDFTEADSTDPTKYIWSRFEGLQGKQGEQGIPGTNGLDGTSYYLHIKYSNDGKTFTSNNGETVGDYIGVRTDTNVNDSMTFSDYTWSKTKGDAGLGIKKLVEQYYLSTSNTAQTGGSWKTSQDKWTTGHYIWTRTQVTWDDDTVTYTDPVLSNNLDEAFSQIEQTKEAIKNKVEKGDFGTLIEQNAEHVKFAWNQISEYLQMMILNGNASFAVLDSNKKVLMSLDKTGQHFFESDGTTLLGDIGVNKDDDNKVYLSFATNMDYGENTSTGMAWGIKTKSDNKFHPIMYLKNYNLVKNGGSYGQLELANCDLILTGSVDAGSGGAIQCGDILVGGSALGGIKFTDIDGNNFLTIIKGDGSFARPDDEISILDQIMFFKNSAGSNSFRIGLGSDKYCLLTDDGDINCDNLLTRDATILGSFNNVSLEDKKKNFEKLENALDIIESTDIYKYNLKEEKDTDKKRIGFVIGKDYKYSKEITGLDKDGKEIGANLYSMISVAYKAIQEQQEEIEELKTKDNQKDKVIQDLLARVEKLERGENNG